MANSPKSAIDRMRDSAGSFEVGTPEDNSAIVLMKQIDNSLYIVKKKSIYAMKLADQIDPLRTNPKLPHNIQQRILPIGSESELVVRTLLAALELFNEHYLPAAFDRMTALKLTVSFLQDLFAMDGLAQAFQNDETTAITKFPEQQRQTNRSLIMPVVGEVAVRCKTFFQKATHAMQSLFEIVKHFYGDAVKRGWFDGLETLVKKEYGSDDTFSQFLSKVVPIFKSLRDTRNAFEHPKANQWVRTEDFTLNAEGTLMPPSIEVSYQKMHLPKASISGTMGQMVDDFGSIFESLIAFLCSKHVQSFGGLPVLVGELPDDYRKAREGVRFGYLIVMGGRAIPAS
jgi:hypothetical protein